MFQNLHISVDYNIFDYHGHEIQQRTYRKLLYPQKGWFGITNDQYLSQLVLRLQIIENWSGPRLWNCQNICRPSLSLAKKKQRSDQIGVLLHSKRQPKKKRMYHKGDKVV